MRGPDNPLVQSISRFGSSLISPTGPRRTGRKLSEAGERSTISLQFIRSIDIGALTYGQLNVRAGILGGGSEKSGKTGLKRPLQGSDGLCLVTNILYPSGVFMMSSILWCTYRGQWWRHQDKGNHWSVCLQVRCSVTYWYPCHI